jgi:hypothetical protein
MVLEISREIHKYLLRHTPKDFAWWLKMIHWCNAKIN